jgi:hypothetical protein
MVVGAVYESGPSTLRYVYRPCVLRPSTLRESKEYDLHPRATSVAGSCFTPSSVRYKDKKENVKSQYKVHKQIQHQEHDKSHQYQENDKQLLLQPNKTTVSMIEVSPGHEVKLRGAAETWHAIQHDFYVPCVCLECDASLFCILDAWLVLCPHCRGLNPIGLNDNGHCDYIMATTTTNPNGGVGLGFTIETLMEAQASMLRDF